MRSARAPLLAGLTGALGLLASDRPASGQNPPSVPTFTSGVELIVVDAVVVDDAGRPVAGLTASDFTLTEDGRPQPIVSFEAFVLGPRPPAGPPPAVATNEGGVPGNVRAFAVILDDLRTSSPLSAEARRAVASFIRDSLRDGDELTLGTTSGEAWWSARLPEGREDLLAVLGRVQGRGSDAAAFARMTDYEAYRIANYEDSPSFGAAVPAPPTSGRGAGGSAESPPMAEASIRARVIRRWLAANLCTATSCDAMVRGAAADHDATRRDLTRATLDAVRRALDSLASVHGRKSLLLVTPGFLQDSAAGLRGVAAASREANTALYFVDVRALMAVPGFGTAEDSGAQGLADPGAFARERAAMRFEEANLASAGARTLAEDTGGFSVRNTNDLAAGIERIADESQAYYLLGFNPPPGKKPGEWRSLKVEVARPGITVRARRGYSLRDDASPVRPKKKERDKGPAPDPVILRALDSAHDAVGIPLRAAPFVSEPRPNGASRVVLAVELDASRASLTAKGGTRTGRLEFSIVATHRDSGRTYNDDGALTVSVGAAEAPAWRGLTRELELPAGVVQARVAVRDPAGGAIGAVTARFEVPPPGGLRLSTPILTDRLEPALPGQPPPAHPRPALAVHRTFAPGGQLYCQFEVFGAARAPDDGRPHVRAGLTLRTGDGRLVSEAAPTAIASDPDGRLVRLVGLPLVRFAPGGYEIVLDVRDEVSGAQVERREAFTLAAEPSPTP